MGAMLPTDQLKPIAVAADELGYASFAIADHVVDLETLVTPYPYEDDGSRRWDSTCEWPDPWVLVGALSAVTTRISFFTSIYVAAMRSPYQVAKSVGTAAVMSGGRVRLGVGVGWCREEFDLLGEDFATRGKRTYPALAGIEQTRAAAQSHLSSALKALEPFGPAGQTLAQLAQFIVARDS